MHYSGKTNSRPGIHPSASSYAHSPSPSLPAVELQFAKVKIEKKIRCLCEVGANMHLCVLERSFQNQI